MEIVPESSLFTTSLDPNDSRLRPRFRSNISVEDCGYVSPCWRWVGQISQSGYALYHPKIREGSRFGHRMCYEALVGPIPEGPQLDHLCRNRFCINPHHLEPVTCRVNLLRGIGPTAKNAAKTHCPHGHEYANENLRFYKGCRLCRKCAVITTRKQRAKKRLEK